MVKKRLRWPFALSASTKVEKQCANLYLVSEARLFDEVSENIRATCLDRFGCEACFQPQPLHYTVKFLKFISRLLRLGASASHSGASGMLSFYQIVVPPSITITLPVTKDEAAEARYTIVPLISSGCP